MYYLFQVQAVQCHYTETSEGVDCELLPIKTYPLCYTTIVLLMAKILTSFTLRS